MLNLYYTKVKKTSISKWIDLNDGDSKALRKISWLGSTKGDLRAYEALMDDYIQHFPMGKDYQRKWDMRNRLIELYNEYLSSIKNNMGAFIRDEIKAIPKRKLLNDIRHLQNEIEQIEKEEAKEEKIKIGKMIGELRKNGASIDENKMSIYALEMMVR